MRNKSQMKLKSFSNNKDNPFGIRKRIINYFRLPILSHDRSLSYLRPLNFSCFDKMYNLSNSKNDSISKDDIKKGIVWLKNKYFQIPKLLLPPKINSIKTPSLEKLFFFSKRANKMKLDNTFQLPKAHSQLVNKSVKNVELNEIFGLKKGKSELNIFENKKKDEDVDKYIEKFGVLKYLNDPILKIVSVGKVENAKTVYKKVKMSKPKINILYKSVLSRYMNKTNIQEKNKFNNKNDKKNNKKGNKAAEYKEIFVNSGKRQRMDFVQKKIDQCNELYKNLNIRLIQLYEKKRKEFEKIVEDEFPLQA